MTTRVGVGYSDLHDSLAAGVAAARAAVALGGITRPLAALLFCTGRHDPARLRDGVRQTLGPAARLIGCYAVGIITREQLGYDGYEVGIAVFESDTLRIDAAIETGLPGAEAAVGRRLADQLAAVNPPGDASLLLFYDSVNDAFDPPRLNMATPLLAGMGEHLSRYAGFAGMGAIGDMQLHPTRQFYDDRVERQAALALVLSGGVRMDTIIMHGCRPAGRYHTVTKSDGPVVLEIDGKPALTMIHDMLGPDSGLTHEDYSFFVTLGVNKGDRFGPFREDDYANRMCIGVDAARQGLVMFEDDLVPGTPVQLMRRSVDHAYVGPRTRGLVERATAAGRRPLLAFYIDCAGRAADYCGADAEEASEVQKALPPDVPLLGVYSGVEIARVGGRPQALDWTGVLCLLSESQPA